MWCVCPGTPAACEATRRMATPNIIFFEGVKIQNEHVFPVTLRWVWLGLGVLMFCILDSNCGACGTSPSCWHNPLVHVLRWVWLGVGVLIFWILVGNVICVLAHQLLGPWDVPKAVMSVETLQEKEFAKRGRNAHQGQVRVNMPQVGLGC